MTVTHKLIKILSGHSFCIKCACDLDLWPTDLKICRGHLLTMTNLPTKYHDCHSKTSRYWADIVFASNATVTLTFDLVTLKFIGVIYWVSPTFLLSTMTVTQKLFKVLSGHDVANGRTDRRRPYHNTSEASLRAYKKWLRYKPFQIEHINFYAKLLSHTRKLSHRMYRL